MKIWVDPVKEAPEGYIWCKSTNETIKLISETALIYHDSIDSMWNVLSTTKLDNDSYNNLRQFISDNTIQVIDMHHYAGEMSSDGGDYINILYWLEEVEPKFKVKIHIHSDHPMNPIGVQMIRNIIKRNNWKELFDHDIKRCDTCEYKYYEPYDEICVRCENYNGYVEKQTLTNRDWLDSLSNTEFVEFLCSDEFDILKRSFTQSDIGLIEWMSKPTNKKIVRK